MDLEGQGQKTPSDFKRIETHILLSPYRPNSVRRPPRTSRGLRHLTILHSVKDDKIFGHFLGLQEDW
jgi:hypothetical protein